MSFRPVQLLFALATVWPCAGATAAEAKPVLLDGLAVTFKPQNGAQADTTVRPHFMLYVPLGQAPTPFVAPGVFTAEWEGVIQLDLRDRFVFQAELNGSFKLELNGAVVLEATSDGGTTEPTRRIRLNSRSNTLKATYTSPPGGDAFFRLYWATPDYANSPPSIVVLRATPPASPRGACWNWRWTPRRSTASARGGTQAGWPSGFSTRPSSGRRRRCRRCCTERPPKPRPSPRF